MARGVKERGRGNIDGGLTRGGTKVKARGTRDKTFR